MFVLTKPNMRSPERLTQLRQLLEDDGSVVVSELAQAWSVSEMTIRRDLSRLEEEGVAARVHGGDCCRRAALAHAGR